MFLYLHGFASGPHSYKARRFVHHLAERGLSAEVPALDEGDFEHLTLTRQLRLIERTLAAAPRPHVLVGSSMGGYLALLHASHHPVDALVVMAPAVDFAARWLARVSPEERAQWERTDCLWVDHHAQQRKAALSYDLARDASLHAPWPRVTAPTLVAHGRRDTVVPLGPVKQWVERTPSAQLLTYDSDHELTDVADVIFAEAFRFLAKVPAVVEAHGALRLGQL